MDAPATGLPRPAVTVEDARRWAREHWGFEGAGEELGSQQDRNVLLTAPTGERRLLKVSNPVFTRAEIEAQNAVMAGLADAGPAVPRPLPAADGAEIVAVDVQGTPHHVRLLTFVDGAPLVDCGTPTGRTLAAVGRTAARTVAALAGLEHPGLERALQWDLRRAVEAVRARLRHVPDPKRRAQVAAATDRAAAALAPLAAALPTQAIHGDLTEDNLVGARDAVGRVDVAGIIDFGDAMTSWRVAELAVACSYVFRHESGRPLAVLPVVRAFDAEVRLTDDEIAALWPLLVLRGATLVVSGEEQVAIDPTNAYAAGALEDEWRMFAVPAGQDPDVMTAALRAALGRPVAAPAAPADATPLVPALTDRPPATVDLSQGSDVLWDGAWLADGPRAEREALRAAAGAGGAAATRFGEPRLTRAAALRRDEPANVALGVELHAPADLELVAPFAGEVEIRDDALVLRGAEAALILARVSDAADDTEADTDAAAPLRFAAAPGPLPAGAPLAAGRAVHVALTAPDAAADRLPPRFATASTFPGWAAHVMDPAPLLGLPVSPPLLGTEAAALDRRTRAYAPLQSHYYAAPPQIERGWREHLIDTTGRHYVDMVNNVTVLGHGHPRIAAAAADQWRRLNTNSRFHYAAVAELSERLLETCPDGFDAVLLVNSGSEAVDLALRLTQAFTGREDVLCVEESYHGWTLASDAVSTSVSDNPRALEVRPRWVHAVDAPNAYRGRHRGDDAGPAYARDAVAEVERLAAAGTPVGTWIAEPRNGNAGAIGLPAGYLPAVYDAIRAGGGVCIADEVQVGYGRQGAWFWGFEEHGVVPDVITVAKAMGDGHPLGAVITRAEIAQALADQGTFFSSSGGSTLSSRIGVEVLDVLRDERLQQNAAEVGEHLKAQVERLAERRPLIGAVHGRGLYLGIELVRDRTTLEPATEETAALCDRMRELGVVVQPTGDRQNVLKVKPPLCFSRASADFFVAMLDEALGAA